MHIPRQRSYCASKQERKYNSIVLQYNPNILNCGAFKALFARFIVKLQAVSFEEENLQNAGNFKAAVTRKTAQKFAAITCANTLH